MVRLGELPLLTSLALKILPFLNFTLHVFFNLLFSLRVHGNRQHRCCVHGTTRCRTRSTIPCRRSSSWHVTIRSLAEATPWLLRVLPLLHQFHCPSFRKLPGCGYHMGTPRQGYIQLLLRQCRYIAMLASPLLGEWRTCHTHGLSVRVSVLTVLLCDFLKQALRFSFTKSLWAIPRSKLHSFQLLLLLPFVSLS